VNMDINRNYRVDSAPRLTDWTTSPLVLMMMMWSLSTPAVRIMIWIVMHEIIETNSCAAARRIIDTTTSSSVVDVIVVVAVVGSKCHGIFLHCHPWP
jgi:hypothetical protein